MKPNLQTIAKCVCTYYGVPEEKVQSVSRNEELIAPRRALIILAFENVEPIVLSEWFERTFNSLRSTRTQARQMMQDCADFRADVSILRSIIAEPEKLFVKKEKVPKEDISYVEVKPLRPRAEYSNRNINEIHDYYAQIRI